MTAIVARNLSKTYSNKLILNNLSISVNKGDIYGLLGLNGIGKTTLIRILLGISSADDGEISVLNATLNQLKIRRKICYLPEKFSPSFELTGAELIKMLVGFHRFNYTQKEINKWCDRFEFDTQNLNRKIRSYSKGMVQKIGLIATFVTNAKLYILDEPMSGLDFQARNILKEELKNVVKKGATVFFTSHVLSDINDICNRVGLLNEGKLVFEGELKTLLKSHKNIEDAVISQLAS